MMLRYFRARDASSDTSLDNRLHLHLSSIDADTPVDLRVRRRELPWTRLDAALQRYDVGEFHVSSAAAFD